MEKLYSVSNMHCAACKATIENTLKKVKGVINVEANVITSSVKVNAEKDITDDIIIKACKDAGYNLTVIDDDSELFIDKKNKSKTLLIKLIIGIVLLIPLLYLGMGSMYEEAIPTFLKEPIYVGLYVQLGITLIIIGLFFNYYKDGAKALVKLSPNMDSLVFLGSLFSLIYSLYYTILYTVQANSHSFSHIHVYYDAAAMILVLVSVGKYIESLTKRKAKNTILELLKLRPKTAHLVKGEEVVDIESKFLKLKDIVLVKPGEVIPADGIIIAGTTSIDESLISGESLPVVKSEDDEVIGGSINGDGSIKVLVNKEKKDSTLSKIISLVMEASNMDTKLTRKIDVVSRYFVPVILGIAIITFIVWICIEPSNFNQAFNYGVSVIVISCPCALGLATPISLLVGSSVFAKNGVLVNKSEAIENIKDVDTLVLDKTNTITKGELEVEKCLFFEKTLQILDKIFTLEKYSNHPLAKGITEYLSNCSLSNEFISSGIEPGKGIYGNFNDGKYYIGNKNYLLSINPKVDEKILKEIDENNAQGLLPLIAFNETKVFAIFYLKDKVNQNASEFVSEAKKYFKKIILLTGDNEIIARKIASEVGIDEVISEVLPTDKDQVIQKLQNEGHKVVMVGDGVNDSIALNRADVGIGIAKGSDIALSSSDFILMRSDLMDILNILKVSKKIRVNINTNLFWAFIYNIVFIPIAAGVFSTLGVTLSPMICSALMALSSVTVCLNSLTLFLTTKKKNEKNS